MTLLCPVPKILLPVDGSNNSKRAVEFSGCLGKLMGKSLSGVTLLHVMPSSYLGRHADYKDFRFDVVKQSDTIQRLREQHIEKDITPFMNDAETILRNEGIETRIEKLVVSGDPSSEIVRIADEGAYSTIMMARRERGKATDELTGVPDKVVHSAHKQTVYVIGHEVLKEKGCPVPRILIPVDGSPYSMKGVEHAACLAGIFKGSVSAVTLLRVISADSAEKNEDIEKEAQSILNEARKIIIQAGVSEGVITTKIRSGSPAGEIAREAEAYNYNLIVVGRKGRSAIKDLILGGVSTSVLQHCANPTVAVVSC